MNRRKTFRPTPQDALRATVDDIGGPQQVGHFLRPEMSPDLAGVWLGHTLTAGRRDKLSIEQIALIFRKGFEAGQHDGFESFAEQLGYRVVAIEPQAELQELSRRAEAAAREAVELSTKVIEQMRHAHLKVGA